IFQHRPGGTGQLQAVEVHQRGKQRSFLHVCQMAAREIAPEEAILLQDFVRPVSSDHTAMCGLRKVPPPAIPPVNSTALPPGSHCPSGEKKGYMAPSVPASVVAWVS